MLKGKFSNKKNEIDYKFEKIPKNANPQHYIDAVITSISICLGISGIYGFKLTNKTTQQAIVSTMIRIYLTPEWENKPQNFKDFQKDFESSFKGTSLRVENFCKALEDAFKKRSGIGMGFEGFGLGLYTPQYKKYSYYDIKKNFFPQDDKCSNIEQTKYEQITTMNLAKLYDRLKESQDSLQTYDEHIRSIDPLENPFYPDILTMLQSKKT